MNETSTFSVVVLFATLAATFVGGLILGPRRVVPFMLLLGPLFLPAGAAYDLPGLPALDRLTAVTVPTAILFVLASADCWRRFRVIVPDLLLVAFVGWSVACTVVNQGTWAGQSMALTQCLTLVVPYLAGRLYLRSAEDVGALARVIAPFVLVYLGMMAFEARMYPRFGGWLYDVDVTALYRFGLYRPVVFAENALELGHTLVLLMALMIAVRRAGGDLRAGAGRLLDIGILAGAVGVLLSLSRGPVIGLGLAVVAPLLLRRPGFCSALLGVSGVMFFVWMLSPGGSSLTAGTALTDSTSETGQTLFYRFQQIEAFKPLVVDNPIFGYGESWERSAFRIIDGALLLAVLGFGYPGMLLLSAFWVSCVWLIGQRTFPRTHVYHHLGAALAPALGWLVFSSWGDSFLRSPHLLIMGGVLGVLMATRPETGVDRAGNPVRTLTLRYG